MAYKEKICEQCGTKHKKRGRFCSRACSDIANKNRKWTAEQKAAVSAGLQQWHATSDTAAVAAHNYVSKGKNQPPEPVAPPTRLPLDDNQFIAGGDIWTNCDWVLHWVLQHSLQQVEVGVCANSTVSPSVRSCANSQSAPVRLCPLVSEYVRLCAIECKLQNKFVFYLTLGHNNGVYGW